MLEDNLSKQREKKTLKQLNKKEQQQWCQTLKTRVASSFSRENAIKTTCLFIVEMSAAKKNSCDEQVRNCIKKMEKVLSNEKLVQMRKEMISEKLMKLGPLCGGDLSKLPLSCQNLSAKTYVDCIEEQTRSMFSMLEGKECLDGSLKLDKGSSAKACVTFNKVCR